MGLPFGSLMIGVFVLLLGFSRQFGRLKANRSVATNLGSITYSMYMIHFPIQFLMVLFSENIIRLDFLTIPVFLVFFVITTAASVACNKTFETRIQRYLRSIFPRSSQSRGENVINKPQHQESEAS
jgi:peptidoglycan/LPS O-acetylase OafA/YrhL